MGTLSDLKMYGRFAWGLRGFLGRTISLEEAQAAVLRRMKERESNFLSLAEKGIYRNPHSPYLPLLNLARCEMGDIRSMVANQGIEDTLRALRESGVYVTFEEYKGREPIVRGGQVFHVRSEDFDNPFLSHYYQAQTGGSTGAGTRVLIDLEHIAALAPHMMLTQDAHGVLNVPTASWLGVLPDDSGLRSMLYRARFGNVPRKWFSPLTNKEFKPALKNRLATRYVVTMGRLMGVPIPWPEPVTLDEAEIIARWAHQAIQSQGSCLITTHVSRALRLCIAAQKEGLDLTGATFFISGEPPTPAKVREITRAGVRFVPGYHFTEVGAVGMGCGNPSDVNDIHLFKDTLALIQYPRQVPGYDVSVDSFHFTTLLPAAPKLLLNVESDDFGILESRPCGCPLEQYGFTDHVREIRSYRKLTGEGMTLVGSEMVRILEEVLPARFGGTSLDYQLLEEEDENGFTRLSLIVSPRIETADESQVVQTVLDALDKSSTAASIARAVWTQAGTLRVRRMEPILTSRGKFMPLQVIRNGDVSRPEVSEGSPTSVRGRGS